MPRPKGKSVVGSQCVYKVKHGVDGSVETYKVSVLDVGTMIVAERE